MTEPQGWELQKAMAIAMATIASLEAEGVDTDEEELRIVLRDQGADVESLLILLMRAASEADCDADILAARIAKLSERKARVERRRDARREAVASIMEALPAVFPNGKYVGAEFTASLRSLPPKGIVTDEDALPEAYWRTSRRPDLAAINGAVRAGFEIPGVVASNGGSSITIREK
jgi:hypothetical protein